MRKRSRAARRPADAGAFLRAIGLQHGLDAAQQADLTLGVRAALLAMTRGAGAEHHAWTLASAANVALVLAEGGAGLEFQDDIIAAQEALVRTIARGQRSGRWGFDGAALAAVSRGLDVYEAQLAAVPRVAARDAVREVERRVRQGHVFEVVTGGVV